MQIFYSPYELRPAQKGFLKENPVGYLLKVIQDDGSIGYSCLQTWPVLGEKPVSEHLQSLKNKQMSWPAKISMLLAARDAEARSQGKSLIRKDSALKNNYLVLDLEQLNAAKIQEILQLGFSTFKVKLGNALAKEAAKINQLSVSGISWRFDFNNKLNRSDLQGFLSLLKPEVVRAIDYIEDPFPYTPAEKVNLKTQVRLALDQGLEKFLPTEIAKLQRDVFILKPARLNCVPWIQQEMNLNNRFLTVTSNMDHPVGVLHAYSMAQELYFAYSSQLLELGCLSFHCYQPLNYLDSIQVQGPYIQKVEGCGIGLDAQLENEKWQKLI